MRDLYHNLSVVKMITAVVGNNDTEGTPAVSVDTKGFGSNLVIANVGVSADTLSGSVKVAVVAEHSDDDSTWAAITAAGDLLSAVAPDANGIIATIDDAAEDDVVVVAGYVGPRRHYRLRLDFTGTHTNGVPIAMIGLRGHPASAPV